MKKWGLVLGSSGSRGSSYIGYLKAFEEAGLKPDYIEIEWEDEILIIKNVIVGIYDNKLSKNNMYSAIVGLNLINSGKIT